MELFIRPVPSELHQQMPWWVGYASLLSTVMLSSLGSVILGAIGAAIAGLPLLGARGKPWYERARQAHSLRVVLLLQAIVWPVVVFVICSMWPFPLAFGSLALRCFPAAMASVAVLLLVYFAGERRIFQRRYSIGQLMRNMVVYHFALGHVIFVVAVVASVAMPRELNLQAPVVLGIAVLLIVFFSCGGSLILLRAFGLFVPADERLTRIVADCARQLNVAAPPTYIARMPVANALAFPWNGRLAFTAGILNILTDEQLGSIAAHEICHLGMPTTQKILRLLHALALTVPLIIFKPFLNALGTSAVLPALLALVGVVMVVQMLGRRMMQREEERADRAGTEANEAVYALALEQIYRENVTPANLKSPQGHPPLYDRMVASGVTPDYDKPRPPPIWIRRVAMLVQTFVVVAMVICLWLAHAVVRAVAPVDLPSQRAVLAFVGGGMHDVSLLGELYADEGEGALGLSLMEYAKHEAPENVEVLARLARAYALGNRCEEARESLDKAELLSASSLLYQETEEALSAAQIAVAGCE